MEHDVLLEMKNIKKMDMAQRLLVQEQNIVLKCWGYEG